MNCTKMKQKMCIPYKHMPKNLEFFNLEQLLKHVLRVFRSLGGGKFNSLGLDHSGSQPSIYIICVWIINITSELVELA